MIYLTLSILYKQMKLEQILNVLELTMKKKVLTHHFHTKNMLNQPFRQNNRQIVKQKDRSIDSQIERWLDSYIERQLDSQMVKWSNRKMDKWIDGYKDRWI